jgi:hypothetical protein
MPSDWLYLAAPVSYASHSGIEPRFIAQNINRLFRLFQEEIVVWRDVRRRALGIFFDNALKEQAHDLGGSHVARLTFSSTSVP